MIEQDNRHSIFLPMLLCVTSVVIWFAFQTFQLFKERESLTALSATQLPIYTNAQKMRAQLDTIAAETAKLAQAGNSHAALIVSELKQRGVTIDPSKAAAQTAR
jgi:hypothetical protein